MEGSREGLSDARFFSQDPPSVWGAEFQADVRCKAVVQRSLPIAAEVGDAGGDGTESQSKDQGGDGRASRQRQQQQNSAKMLQQHDDQDKRRGEIEEGEEGEEKKKWRRESERL